MNKHFFFLLCLLALSIQVFASGRSESAPRPASEPPQVAAAAAKKAEPPKTWREMNAAERAEKMMKSLAAAYPDKIEKAEFREGDWAVLMKGTWYYCADGRLLPEELLPQKEAYARQSFYDYFAELPEWKAPEGEQAERLKNARKNLRSQSRPKRDPSFYDGLWGAHSHSESYDNLVFIRFLQWGVLVHRDIASRLKKVEARILEAEKTDAEVAAFTDNIGKLDAWNWRTVAATQSRSYHSYGVAIDLQPKNFRGKQTFWQWTADFNAEWYNTPYSQRFHPPGAVVKAFEAYGFCWGGKWPLYDTMHFEYRPEIFLMHDLPVEINLE